MQGLYEFKGADIRFLTMATQIWTGFSFLKTAEFVACQLKTSYRITNQMADFVNNVMLGEKRLHACREGEPVLYIRRRIHDIQKIVVYTIKELIETRNATPSDIFVLGGSVKGPNSHIRNIENALVEAGIPCHVPMMENADNFDENVIKGKVVFSSFHTSKGRQRPYVFVVGFDHSYFKTIARTLDPNVCPNTLYVATTRASQKMYLLESDNYASDRPFKFLKQTHNEMRGNEYIDFRGIPQTLFEDDSVGQTKTSEIIVHKTTPTDMTKFVPETVLEEITHILDGIFTKELGAHEEGGEIQLPTILKTKTDHYEDVSDLNGIAIPSMLYDYIVALYDDSNEATHNSILYDMIKGGMSQTKANKHMYLKEVIKQLNPVCETVTDYLYMANVYQSVEEKLYFKLKQIERDEYNWLSPTILQQCKRRMMQVLGEEIMLGEPKIEHTIITYLDEMEHGYINDCLACYFPENEKFQFSARVDLMTETTLWELKCTSEITAEHMIQTVIYAWIMKTIQPKFSKKVKIFNIRTGQILRLDADKSVLDKVVVALLKGKYMKQIPFTEEEFLTTCRQYI
jgi:ribosomal protein S7